MKKLMFAIAAVVGLAFASQAAVVAWGLSSALTDKDGTKLAGKEVTLWLVNYDGEGNDLQIDSRNTLSNPAAKKGQLSAGTGASQTVAFGANNVNDVNFNISASSQVYFKVIDGDYTYTSSSVALTGLTAETMANDISFTGNWTATSTVAGTKDAWVSVPEPTSGLLMLVGLGALALRRRRA